MSEDCTTPAPGAGPAPATSPYMQDGLDAHRVLDVILEHSPGYIFVKDPEFRIIAASAQFLALYPEEVRDQVMGRTTFEAYPPEQRENFLAHDREAMRTGLVRYTETVDFPNGERRTLLTSKVGFDQQSGRYLVGMAVDITELRAANEQLTYFGTLAETAGIQIYVGSLIDGRITNANAAARDATGLSEEALRATTIDTVLELDGGHSLLEVRESLAAGESIRGLEGRCIHSDGSSLPTHIHLYRSAGEEMQSVVAFVQDATDIVESRARLTARNAELLEFSYRMSHDLKSPSVSSLALIQTLKEDLKAGRTDASIEILETVERSLTRLVTLTEDIGRLAAVDWGEVELRSVPLEDVVTRVLASLAGLIRLSRADIRRDYDPELVVLADPDRLHSVVFNLVSNAIKYGPEGEPPQVRIVARRDRRGVRAILRIEDNGRGVPVGSEERLFTMFERLHHTNTPGSGLGLYFTRKCVRSMGGEVHYERLHGGSCFRVELRAAKPEPDAERSER